jgi:hypothetical protein
MPLPLLTVGVPAEPTWRLVELWNLETWEPVAFVSWFKGSKVRRFYGSTVPTVPVRSAAQEGFSAGATVSASTSPAKRGPPDSLAGATGVLVSVTAFSCS